MQDHTKMTDKRAMLENARSAKKADMKFPALRFGTSFRA